jgi:uncharacterized protein YwgA
MTQHFSAMDFVTQLIALNGGKLVGKTRLQKTAFLIQALLRKDVFDFDYHHYGPFSEDLAETIDIATARGRITQESRIGFYEMPYVVFATKEKPGRKLFNVDAARIKEWLRLIERTDAISLELAATRLYLQSELGVAGGSLDQQLRQLKPQKATPEKLKESKALLQTLAI